MIITKIQKKKLSSLYYLFIDNKIFCEVSGKSLLELKLKKGLLVEDNLQNNILKRSYQDLILDKSFRLLSIKPYTSRLIKQKLTEFCYKKALNNSKIDTKEIVQNTIEYLKDNNYIDELSLAKQTAKKLISSSNPKSLQYIKKVLISKGVNIENVNEALNSLDATKEAENIKKLAVKKLNTIRNRDRFTVIEIRNKLHRYLLSKGYKSNDIYPVVDSLSIEI